MSRLIAFCCAVVLSCGSFLAVSPVRADEAPAAGDPAAALLSGLNFRSAPFELAVAKAKLTPQSNFRVLDAKDARKVLEDLWGNPPDDSILAMLVPTSPALSDEHSWAVVVTYSDDGYVSDDDAQKTDYDKLLKDLQEQTRDANEERKRAGYGSLQLVGWAAKPRYDSSGKKLYWAKELASENAPGHTLNYDIRVLGRRGYLSLNAVAAMSDLPTVERSMQDVLSMAEFENGERYADYNSGTDKLAGYGLAALVGGAVAAKAGLFAKLFAVLLAAKKLVVVAFLGIVAAIKKLFGRKA